MTNKRRFTRKERIAYHEAGHAVMAHILHKRIKGVSILPDKDIHTLGKFEQGKSAKIDFSETSPKTRYELEKQVMIDFAGEVVEYLLIGKFDKLTNIGSSTDWHYAYDFILTQTDYDVDESEAYAHWLWLRTKGELKIDYQWNAIQVLAQELIKRNYISGRYAREIIQQSIKDFSESLRAK